MKQAVVDVVQVLVHNNLTEMSNQLMSIAWAEVSELVSAPIWAEIATHIRGPVLLQVSEQVGQLVKQDIRNKVQSID